MVLRWFLDGTRLKQLTRDDDIDGSTAYRLPHEGIDALTCARTHGLVEALSLATIGCSTAARCARPAARTP